MSSASSEGQLAIRGGRQPRPELSGHYQAHEFPAIDPLSVSAVRAEQQADTVGGPVRRLCIHVGTICLTTGGDPGSLTNVATAAWGSSMADTLMVRKIGNSYGVILGRDLMDTLGLREGDALFVIRTAQGIELTPFDPDFAEAVEAGRDYMHRHRNAMRELAR